MASPRRITIITAVVAFLGIAACVDPEPPDLSQVLVMPDSALLVVADTVQLSVVVLNRNGQVIADQVTWTTSDSTVATIGADGRVIGRRVGSAQITARANGRIGLAKVVVIEIAGCAGTGTTHTGVVGTEIWHAERSPHFISDSVKVWGEVTVERGAFVCGLPGSLLIVEGGEFNALGTESRPITFTAADSSRGWLGIDTRYTAALDARGEARLRFAQVSFTTRVGGVFVEIEDSWLRNVNISACALYVRRTEVDTGTVSLPGGVLEDNIIRVGSVRLLRPATLCGGMVALNGGRIENSPGVALEYNHTVDNRAPAVTSTRPLRITGSRGYPVNIMLTMFQAVWPTLADQDSLLGNHNDTLSIQSVVNGFEGAEPAVGSHLHVRRDFPLMLRPPYFGNTFPVDSLTIEPGATVVLDGVDLIVTGRAHIVATPAMPVRITNPRYPQPGALGFRDFGLRLRGSGQSDLSNVVFAKAHFSAAQQHSAKLNRIESNHWIELSAPGSEIADAAIHDFVPVRDATRSPVALRLGASGVVVRRVTVRRASGDSAFNQATARAVDIAAPDVSISECEIVDNTGDGVRVTAANVRINECNIERNSGLGVNNIGTAPVDARRNWWGDPAGPLGPNGDGVNGDVDYSEHRTTPLPPIVFRLR